jgi:hypothetical protein
MTDAAPQFGFGMRYPAFESCGYRAAWSQARSAFSFNRAVKWREFVRIDSSCMIKDLPMIQY